MSVVCGIYALTRDAPIPADWASHLRECISRAGAGATVEFSAPSIFLLKLDLGIFGDAAWQVSPGGVAMAVSGDPVLGSRRAGQGRGPDVRTLAAATDAELLTLLRDARGSFNLARYDAAGHRLKLATDRLGARPIYWLQTGDFLVFSGIRRLLCDLPHLYPAADLTGVVEAAAFGFPLGERTEIDGVASLQGGKVITAGVGKVAIERYWNWCRDAGAPEKETPRLHEELFESFRTAISLRLGNAGAAFSTLSAGLDSRCVATVLRSYGIELHTLNASWQGTLDQHIARRYAAAIGSHHHEHVLPDEETGRQMVRRCGMMMREHAAAVEGCGGRPAQLWGGNDGSISVGYVYISAASIAALRAGNLRGGAQHFLGSINLAISARPFRGALGAWAAGVPLRSVVSELETLDCADVGQRLFYFLLVNHQRRLLAWHLEDIDLYPYEHIEPFFDTALLSVACRLPVDESVGHGLYHRWLAQFPPVVASIPWQVYPGHVPCPLPMPDDTASQWDVARDRLAPGAARVALAELDEILAGKDHIDAVLSRRKLALLRLGNRLGVIDSVFAFRQAVRVAHALRFCDGRVAPVAKPRH